MPSVPPAYPPETTRQLATTTDLEEVTSTPGPPGTPGTPGVGTPGPPGADGADGTDGVDGQSVTVFVQLATPTANAVGDLWIKS